MTCVISYWLTPAFRLYYFYNILEYFHLLLYSMSSCITKECMPKYSLQKNYNYDISSDFFCTREKKRTDFGLIFHSVKLANLQF